MRLIATILILLLALPIRAQQIEVETFIAIPPFSAQGNVGHISAGLSVSVPFLANNISTHTIVVDVVAAEGFGGCGTITTPTDTRSNTYTVVLSPIYMGPSGSNFHVASWAAYNVAAGANTITVADTCSVPSVTSVTVAIHEYPHSSGLDVSSGLVSVSTGVPVTPSITTTVPSDLLHLFSMAAGGSGIPAFSQTSGYTQREIATFSGSTFGPPSLTTWDSLAGSPGSYSNTSTSNSIAPFNGALLIALKP